MKWRLKCSELLSNLGSSVGPFTGRLVSTNRYRQRENVHFLFFVVVIVVVLKAKPEDSRTEWYRPESLSHLQPSRWIPTTLRSISPGGRYLNCLRWDQLNGLWLRGIQLQYFYRWQYYRFIRVLSFSVWKKREIRLVVHIRLSGF